MSVSPELLSSQDQNMAQVTSAIAALADGAGDDTLIVSAIKDQVSAAVTTPIRGVLVSRILLELVSSNLALEVLIKLWTSLFESLSEEHREAQEEILAVALVETVDAVQFIQDDVAGLTEEVQYGKDVADKAVRLLAQLVNDQIIPKHLANLILSPEALLTLRLHPYPEQPASLQRNLVRLTTSTYFKQRTTNLLRESSEGFSRLIVVLTDPDVIGTGDEDEADRKRRATRVWHQVRSLIGDFGLAPIRVYDLIMEVASCLIATHWRFFLDLLGEAGFKSRDASQTANPRKDELYRIEHCLDTDPEDDQTLAKALSFRLKWYKVPPASQTADPIPTGLLFLTALLIKFGFVKAGHLIPSLSPDEDAMDERFKKYQATMTQRSGPNNALANTVLADDDAPVTANGTPVEVIEPPKPEVDQKSLLLYHLLAIGEADVSLYLLAKYPWTAQADPRIASVLLRNIEYIMDPVYQKISAAPGGQAPYAEASEQEDSGHAKSKLSLHTPTPPSTSRYQYEFFFPDWNDNVELWETTEDVYQKGERWFSLIRALGGRDVAVMTKLCRIITHHFELLRQDKVASRGEETNQNLVIPPTESEIAPWRGIIRNTLLPALSVSEATQAAFDHELQDLFRLFEWETVASFLGEWRDGITNAKSRTNSLPAVHATTKSTREIKQALARVTAAQSGQPGGQAAAENKGPSRALAKHGHANPLGLWTTGNGQVMSYGSVGNIGEYFMEVARYSNSLSKDVAMFTWVDTLASNQHNRSVENLATFVGLINRRFIFNLNPLLKLIASGLKGGEEYALVVVEKLMSGMTGEDIVANGSTSDTQMAAFAAGPEMIREAFYESEITSGERTPLRSKDLVTQVRKSIPRLTRALQDTGLAIPILVGLARMATQALLYDADIDVKAMGNKKDNTREIFVQYSDFIAQQLPRAVRASDMPTIEQLYGRAGIEAQLCWVIMRNKLGAIQADEEVANGMEVDSVESGNWWPSALDSTVQEVTEFLEKSVKDVMGAGFYVRFNTLSASDIVDSSATYDLAHERLTKHIRTLTNTMADPKLLPSKRTAARWDLVNLQSRDRQLTAEKQKQKEHVERVRNLLQTESEKWFTEGRDGVLIQQLHDQCFYRRAIQSPADAYFVAKFIRMAHDFNVPGFSTALSLNLFFQAKVATKIYECTENEAQNFGRCLFLLLTDLDAWYQGEDRYYKEALGGSKPEAGADLPEYPLRGMYFRLSPDQPKRPMSWDRFKDYYAKLHNNLTSSLKLCLSDERYYSPKNAVLIALRLLPFWPIMESNSKLIESEVKKVLARGDVTPDVIPAFNSYLAQLGKRKRERPVVPASKFHPAAAAKAKKAEAEAKAKAVAAAKIKAEEQAKAKAEAEAKAAEEGAPIAVDEKSEQAAKCNSASPAAADSPSADPSATSAPRTGADAKALRLKLQQDRAAREAKRQAAESPAPTPAARTPSTASVHPDRQSGLAMGPPAETLDEARAAARARKFGAITSESTPASPRAESRQSTPRHSPPPGPRAQRSGTDDSRVSDSRSRKRDDDRDRRSGREGRDGRDRERDRDGRDRDRRERRHDDRHREESRDGRDARDRHDRHRDRDREEPRDRDHRRGEAARPASREAAASSQDRGGRDAPRPADQPRDRRDGRDRDHNRRDAPREPSDGTRTPNVPQPSREAPPHQPDRRDDRSVDIRGRHNAERDRRSRRGDDTPNRPADARDDNRAREPPRGPREDAAPAAPRNEDRPAPEAQAAREAPFAPRETPAQPERQAPTQERPQLRDSRRPSNHGSRELLPPTPSPATTPGPLQNNSLAARMGLAPMASPPPGDVRRDDRDRKRPLDVEGAPSSREGSPNSKRRRGGGREREERGERRSGGNRIFGGAMRAASGKRQLE